MEERDRTRVGGYQVIRRLGAGGMGVVYEAVDEGGLRVALKTLPTADRRAVMDLKSEYRRVADVAHPNLVTRYELVADQETCFFTMELVDGADLLAHVRGALAPGAPLDSAAEERLRAALSGVVAGVRALHGAGLLHLDLKPANVLVERGGRVVILDFGLTQSLRRRPGTAGPEGDLAGTPMYVAPELVLGEAATAASDWYAVGVMLFQALTGEDPFSGAPMEALLARTREPAPPPSARANVAADLGALCEWLLSIDPAARPGGDELLKCLTEAGNGGPDAGRSFPAGAELVGREAELAALHEAFREAAARPLLVEVKGSSGIGKSALVERFLVEAEGMKGAAEGAVVLAGRCYEWDSVPFKGLDTAADALARILMRLPAPARRAIVEDDAARVAPIFPTLGALHAGGVGAVIAGDAAADPPKRRRLAFTGFKRILGRLAARRRVILFLDDVHWADADSARLLLELLSPPDAAPLLVIISYRGDDTDQGSFLREIAAQAAGGELDVARRTIEVRPLGPEAALALTRARLGGDEARAQVLADEGAGVPILLQELSDYAAESREAKLPATLDRLVEARLARMPEEARRLLRTVAVAGRPTELLLLCRAAGTGERPLAALSLLRSAHLVRTNGLRGTDVVEPFHDRIRRSVTDALAPAARAATHRDLAHTLESAGGAPSDVLAHHFQGAGELPRAADYSERAAEEAVAALAFDRAAELFESAARLCAEPPSRLRSLRIRRARALSNAGRLAGAAPLYLDAAETGEVDERRELRRLAMEAWLTAGHVDAALDVAKPLLGEAGLAYPRSAARALLSVLGQVLRLKVRGIEFDLRPEPSIAREELFSVDLCWSLGKGLSNVLPAQGALFMIQSLRRALALGEPHRIGRGLAFIGTSVLGLALGFSRSGEAYVSRAEELGRELDDPYLQGLSLVLRALSEIAETGRGRRALEQVDRGVEILRGRCTGASWELTLGGGLALKALETNGDIGEVGRRAAQWHREAEDRGDLFGQVMAAQYEVLSFIAAGDVERARRQDERTLSRWARGDYSAQHLYSMMLRVYCFLYEGRAGEALGLLEHELPDIERAQFLRLPISRISIFQLKACLQLDQAFSMGDDERGARRRLLASCAGLGDRLAKEKRLDGPAHASLIRAGVARCRGQKGRALELLDEARQRYEDADMLLWAACVERRQGELGERAEVAAAADARARSMGVVDLERWSRVYAPRFV